MIVDWSRPQKADSRVMDYAWGEAGPEAYLGRLTGGNDPGPKAELWMGAHPKSPSKVGGKGLDQWFAEKPELLGKESLAIDPSGLPYLFKILSAAQPLSIQLHPNKQQAALLHTKDPVNYPDDNHKPEIAIALEEHEALLGFEPIERLLEAFGNYPELELLLDAGSVAKLKTSQKLGGEKRKQILKEVFSSLFQGAKAKPDLLRKAVTGLRKRLLGQKDLGQKAPGQKDLGPKESWFLQLAQEGQEGDVGLFCLFFLNYRVLQPGEGVFLKADVPHAYLRGNIVECMANSDNVVRAGLTPKCVDVDTLTRIVEVELEPLAVQRGTDNGRGGEVYRVPVKEFEVHHWTTGGQALSVELTGLLGPRFGVVIEGRVGFDSGDAFSRGEVFFLSDLCLAGMNLDSATEIFMARPAS